MDSKEGAPVTDSIPFASVTTEREIANSGENDIQNQRDFKAPLKISCVN